MDVRRVAIIGIICIQFFLLSPLFAQKPHSLETIDSEYKTALELFQKQKYGAAQNHFLKALEAYQGKDSEWKTDAEFYAALCAVELFNEDAEYLIQEFIRNHPESPKAKLALFELALFEYQNKNYRGAVRYFEGVDRMVLSETQLAEFYFKSGYSYFMVGNMEKASLAFFEIKDINTAYTSPAIYYYAHIAYSEKNYETALREFRRLTDDENFSPVVPFYIVQILYLQKNYDEILEYAPPLLETATPSRAIEIEKFIGDAYHKKERYQEAIPHLEKYMAESRTVTREDRYQLGFAYYQVSEFEKAAQLFERVTGSSDLLSQNAYYLLADCYLRTERKDMARMAFSSASKMDFDETIKEDALFNFAKITYELSYSPFNEAIRALNQYIEEYAHSDRIDEAYEFLMQAYLNTRNYKEALESLNKIQEKNDRIKSAYQRVAFYRGLELFNDLKFDEAVEHFDLSLEYEAFDMTIRARAYYWRGEAYYRLNDFEMAFDDYQEFIGLPGAFETIEFQVAHYNLGYIYFSEKAYSEALNWFRKYVNLAGDTKSKMMGDALNRIADCYFIKSDYQTALSFYQRAIDLGLSGSDYAMFQKGIILGVTNNHQEKIRILTSLLEKIPSSAYVDDALFERGKSFVTIENFNRAIEDYKNIIDELENSSYVPKAMVQLGLVYYSMNRNEDAISWFTRAIENYRGTEEAHNALAGLKNVYVDLNEVEQYFDYVRNLGDEVTVTLAEQDSLTYITGENLYMAGNCERAVQTLNTYIERFDQGNFLLNAHFYKAECEMKLGDVEKALASYTYVIESPRSLFTEPALVAAAAINFKAEELHEAIEQYAYLEGVAELPNNLLIARLGLMRSFYILENYNNTIDAAKKLLTSDKVSEEMAREAYFKIAKSHYALEQLDQAQSNFRRVASEVKSIEGAESKYRVAEIYFLKEQFEKAEQEINQFLELNTPHPYWMAKIFILDADIKVRKEDFFQAKHMLQAIIDYYEEPNDGIIEEASRKYNEIVELEQFLNAPAVQDTIRLNGAIEMSDTIFHDGKP